MRRLLTSLTTLALVGGLFLGTPRSASALIGGAAFTYNVWVATTGSEAAPGSSCANPGFVGTTQVKMQAAVDAASAAGATVHICPGTYHFTQQVTGIRGVSFQGEGETAADVVIDGDHATRLFSIGGAVWFKGLTLKEGSSLTTGGGAVLATGAVLVTDSVFMDNYADASGGAIAIDEASYRSVTVENSTFSGNSVDDRGGAIATYGEVIIDNSLFEDNVSTADSNCIGGGGAIAAGDDVYVTNSAFNNNVSELSTGYCRDEEVDQGGTGGAIATFALAFIHHSSFTANQSARAGSAILSLNRTATGGGHVESVINNGSSFTNNVVTSGATWGGTVAQFDSGLTIDGVTFTGNVGAGSAIRTINADRTVGIYDSTFTDNEGGITHYGEDLVVSGSTFERNSSANHSQGAIYNSSDVYDWTTHVSDSLFVENEAQYGGAISTGTYLIVERSSFVNNHANGTGGAITGNRMVITGSTFNGNTSPRGGAIWFCNTVEVVGNSFSRNGAAVDPYNPLSTGVGGAIGGWADALVTGNTFSANWAARAGGAYWLDLTGSQRSTLQQMTGNRFVRNHADVAGGALGYNPDAPKLTAAELKAWQRRNKFTSNRGGRTPIIGSYVISYSH